MNKMDRKKMRQDLFLAQLRSHLSHPFDILRECFDSVENVFRVEQKRILDWMDRKTAGLSQDEKDQFYAWYSEDHWKVRDSFPRILRNSLFTAVYSELEDMLKLICHTLAREKGCIVSVYEWRGGVLDKIESCLKKDLGIRWSPTPSLWNKIVKIRSIRNTIVHKGGWLHSTQKGDQELLKYISEEIRSITLIGNAGSYKIQLTDFFIPETLDTFNQLFDELYTPISECIRRGTMGRC